MFLIASGVFFFTVIGDINIKMVMMVLEHNVYFFL